MRLSGKHDKRQSHLGALERGKKAKTRFRETYWCTAFHSLIQVSFTWSLSSSLLETCFWTTTLTLTLPIFENDPGNFPFSFGMTQCLFPTLLFVYVYQILPVTKAVPTALSQPRESSMQGLPEWDCDFFSDQEVIRLENFFPKRTQGNVMVKNQFLQCCMNWFYWGIQSFFF